VDLYLEDTVIHTSVILNNKKETFSFTCDSKPLLVNVDADKSLLCTKKDEHTREEWRYQYRNAPLYLDRYEAIQGIIKDYKAGSSDAAVVQAALSDKAPKIRSVALENCGTLVKSDSTAMLRILNRMAISDTEAEIRKTALKALKKNFTYGSYQEVVEKALRDSSYEVTAAAFGILADKDLPAAEKAVPLLMQDSAGAVLAALAEYFEKDTTDDRTGFYGRAIRKSKGWDRYSILKSYGKYLKNQPDSILETAIGQLTAYCEYTPQRFAKSAAIAELRGINRTLEDRMNSKKTDATAADKERASAMSGRIKEVLDKYDQQQKSK
jgi:aminopeptidase N